MSLNSINKINPITNFVNQKQSRYSLNNDISIDDTTEYQMYTNPPILEEIKIDVGDRYEQVINNDLRLDSLANYYYNDPKLWWVIAYVNDLKDPFDFKIGDMLRIPPMSSLIKSGVIS